jgi:hypothetical protein
MHRLLLSVAAAALVLTAGCVTQAPTTATSMEPKIRAKVEKGVIEPGFTPEMVYLALGKPSEPAQSLADATTNGTWVYHDFNGTKGDIVKAGYRRRVTVDPAKKTEVITTERIEPQALSALRAHSLHVTFRDGRVVEIQRAADS